MAMDAGAEPSARGARRVVFSSEQLPETLSERGRRERWRSVYSELYGSLEVDYARERPLWARFEFLRYGDLGVASCTSTTKRFVRTRHCVAAAGSDNAHLAINGGRTPMRVRQHGREATLAPGAMALVSDALPGEFEAGAVNRWIFVTLPEARLRQVAAGAGSLAALPVDGSRPASRFLFGFVELLLGLRAETGDERLDDHVATTLCDLLALVLGDGREAREIAAMRGLRAARLQSVLEAIRAGYAEPGFSVRALAATSSRRCSACAARATRRGSRESALRFSRDRVAPAGEHSISDHPKAT